MLPPFLTWGLQHFELFFKHDNWQDHSGGENREKMHLQRRITFATIFNTACIFAEQPARLTCKTNLQQIYTN